MVFLLLAFVFLVLIFPRVPRASDMVTPDLPAVLADPNFTVVFVAWKNVRQHLLVNAAAMQTPPTIVIFLGHTKG